MPSNEFSKCSQELAERDVRAVEDRFGISIPSELRAHYLPCNGGTPERKCWPDEGDDPLCLKHFIPIRPALLPADAFGKTNTVQDALAALREGPHIPPELLPFAEDWGGNYFCIEQQSGAIYYFAMDLGDDLDRATQYLAPSFAVFVAGLIDDEDD